MKKKVDLSFQWHKTIAGRVQQPSGETFVIQYLLTNDRK